jgi:hypothetical protein
LSSSTIYLNFTLNGKTGSYSVSGGHNGSITIEMPTSGNLLQGILNSSSLSISSSRSGSGTGTHTGKLKNNAVLTIDFNEPEKFSQCTTPSNVTISPSSVAPGGSATLKWDASTAGGDGHSVSGYYVYECDTSSGTYT